MTTPLELFRAWERDPRANVVHVLQIDRGDGSASRRLTLTDRPYYDKGVAGVKYHQTYPAPVHCIISDLVTDERMNGTTIADFVLINADSAFDEIAGVPNIYNMPWTLLRGDASWSLMETDLPYRFVEIARGIIEDVEFPRGRNEVVLKPSPVKYRHERLIGEANKPIAFGYCFNAPATLEDSGLNRWRFNTVWTSDNTGAFIPRDGGVDLTLTTDFTLVTESNEFRGLIELTGASPTFQLTCDLNFELGTTGDEEGISRVIRPFVIDHFVEDYSLYADSLDISGHGSSAVFGFTSATKAYFYDNTNGIFQYTLADPISSATYDSLSFDPGGNFVDGWLSSDEAYLYLSVPPSLRLFSLGTPGDISTLTSVSSYNLSTGLGISDMSGIALSDDEGTLFVLATDGTLYEISIPTPRTLSGLTIQQTIAAGLTGAGSTLDRSSDMRYLYAADDTGCIVQIELDGSESLSSAFDSRREYSMRHFSTRYPLTTYGRPCLTRDGTRILSIVSNETVVQYDLPEAWLLPRRVFTPRNVRDYVGGCFYQGQVEAGRVLTDLLANVYASYAVSRLGDIVASSYVDPTDQHVEENIDIDFSDFIGSGHDHVRQVSSFTPADQVTLTYRRNYTMQTREQLGAVSDDDAQDYANPHSSTSVSSTLTLGESPREVLVETGLTQEGAEVLDDRILDLWEVPRKEYELTFSLGAISLLSLSEFGVGSLVRVGDWRTRLLSEERYMHIRLDNGRASTPDSATNSITGAFTIIVKVGISDLTPSAARALCGKWLTTGNHRSLVLMLESTGHLSIYTSADGSTETTTTMTTTLASHGHHEAYPLWLKVDFLPSNGSNRVATFSYCYATGNEPPDDEDFTVMEQVLGATVSGIFDSDATVRVGLVHTNTVASRVYRFILKNGIDGDVVSDFDPRRWESGVTLDSSVIGETWTLSTSTGIDFHDAQVLVTGRRVNWSRNEQTLTVFQ